MSGSGGKRITPALGTALFSALLFSSMPARAELPFEIKFYGFLNAEVEYARALGGATPYTARGRVSDGSSRVGVAGTYAISDDTKALVQLEVLLGGFEQGGVDDLGHIFSLRNSFIGMDDTRFGKLLIGQNDSAYRSLVGTGNAFGGNWGLTALGLDLWSNTSAGMSGAFGSLFGRGEARLKNSVHYFSPEIAGIRLAASYGLDELMVAGGRRDHASVALLYSFDQLSIGIGFAHQANTGVDTVRLRRGLGMNLGAVNDEDVAFYKAIVSYVLPWGTYLGVGYERGVYGFSDFPIPTPPSGYTQLVRGTQSQGAAMASIAQPVGDATLMVSVGKLGTLSNSLFGSGDDYGATQISAGVKYAFSKAFMAYAYFTRIDNKPLQSLTLGVPLYSNGAGSEGAFLAPGDKPTAGGAGLIARF